MQVVTLAELRAKLVDPNVTVLNVLSSDYFRAARIPGTISLPYDEIRARASAELPDRHREIITYCGSHT